MSTHELLDQLGLTAVNAGTYAAGDGWLVDERAPLIDAINPASGEVIARVRSAQPAQYEQVMNSARRVARDWARVPAPKRGEAVRLVAEELRRTSPRSAASSRSRWARSRPKAMAKCRR
jgi:aldehyde dehydrogenase (NAD+)